MLGFQKKEKGRPVERAFMCRASIVRLDRLLVYRASVSRQVLLLLLGRDAPSSYTTTEKAMPKVASRQPAPEARRQREARRQGEPLVREGRQPEGLW